MSPSAVSQRLAALHLRIAAAEQRAGRAPGSARLLAVAKTATEQDLQEAWAAGQRSFAHNRVQALLRDAAFLPQAEWHAIGPLQGNKVRDALHVAAWVQTIGELRTAERLARALTEPDGEQRRASGLLPVLLQVNLQPEDGRYGCPIPQLESLASAAAALPGLAIRGLMTIASPEASGERLRADFARLREAAGKLAAMGRLPSSPELSMGMSDDFEIAIEEGATLVRIGRLIFPPPSER